MVTGWPVQSSELRPEGQRSLLPGDLEVPSAQGVPGGRVHPEDKMEHGGGLFPASPQCGRPHRPSGETLSNCDEVMGGGTNRKAPEPPLSPSQCPSHSPQGQGSLGDPQAQHVQGAPEPPLGLSSLGAHQDLDLPEMDRGEGGTETHRGPAAASSSESAQLLMEEGCPCRDPLPGTGTHLGTFLSLSAFWAHAAWRTLRRRV
jgi:hypothetical protein